MDEQVLRREFLKRGCGGGLCTCAGSALMAQTGAAAQQEKEKEETAPQQDPAWRLQWWQKHTYETLLGKKVEVDIKESVLRGSKRCVFQVRILA